MAFVRACHDAGIKVVFDGVFNHTGRDFFAFQDICAKREASPYRDWYCNVNFWGDNEYHDGFSYDNWGGYDLLAKLNQRNPAVRDYICDVVRFWIETFDVDGKAKKSRPVWLNTPSKTTLMPASWHARTKATRSSTVTTPAGPTSARCTA